MEDTRVHVYLWKVLLYFVTLFRNREIEPASSSRNTPSEFSPRAGMPFIVDSYQVFHDEEEGPHVEP